MFVNFDTVHTQVQNPVETIEVEKPKSFDFDLGEDLDDDPAVLALMAASTKEAEANCKRKKR